MKRIITLAVSLVFACIMYAQTCGTEIFVDEFNTTGAIPTEWTEFNTSGQVAVEDGLLKFDYIAAKPSAYRSFAAQSTNVTASFDVKSTRNWVKCKVNLYSSAGKCITGLIIGNDGQKNIQYATSISNSVPSGFSGSLIDGNYNSNTLYSVDVCINFENNELTFYQGGELKASGIAFLETASDIAKIEIIQESMYSNSGQFYFDNVKLAEQGIDRTGLSSAIAVADESVSNIIISPKYGYSEDFYLSLRAATEAARIVLLNCDASETDVEQAESDLTASQIAFDESYVDEDVITFFTEYNFTGTEVLYKCGYYNGNLGDFDNRAVSFKLDSGYMATLGQDVNCQGFSKVYIAEDGPLELNLPAELQRTISFIRVSPWYPSEKKGSCGKGADVMDALTPSWYYNWGPTAGETTSPDVGEFVPMSWSGGDKFISTSVIATMGQNMAFNHHLAFNEPDLEDQANMTVERALELYPQLLASGLRIGAPAVSNVSYSLNKDSFNVGSWIVEFMDSCVARGYRVDFIPVHEYVRYSGSQHCTRFGALAERFSLPIWVTEFNYGNPNIGSAVLEDDVELAKIQNICEAFDAADFIERYSMFYFQISNGQLTIFESRYPVVLNALGEYTRDHVSPDSYSQEVYEEGDSIGPDPVTGLVDPEAENFGIALYPNPVSQGVLKVAFSNELQSQVASVRIYNVSGDEIMNQSISSQEINVSHLESGFYIVKVQSGNKQLVQQVIINK